MIKIKKKHYPLLVLGAIVLLIIILKVGPISGLFSFWVDPYNQVYDDFTFWDNTKWDYYCYSSYHNAMYAGGCGPANYNLPITDGVVKLSGQCGGGDRNDIIISKISLQGNDIKLRVVGTGCSWSGQTALSISAFVGDRIECPDGICTKATTDSASTGQVIGWGESSSIAAYTTLTKEYLFEIISNELNPREIAILVNGEEKSVGIVDRDNTYLFISAGTGSLTVNEVRYKVAGTAAPIDTIVVDSPENFSLPNYQDSYVLTTPSIDVSCIKPGAVSQLVFDIHGTSDATTVSRTYQIGIRKE